MALALGTSATDLRVGSSSISRMAKGSTAFWDADAADYVSRVQAADGEALELGVVAAYHAFCLGCKDDGIWDAIQACCVMAGARTVAGALVPLKGASPTGYNWVSSDYSRSLGLQGDGSTKYIDTNRAANADGQDDCHVSVFPTSITTTTTRPIGCFSAGYADDTLILNGDLRCRSIDTPTNLTVSTGSIYGYARTASTAFTARAGGTTTAGRTAASVAPGSLPWYVFSYNDGGSLYATTDARLAFYSIGASLDLALLDARVSALMTAIGAAL